jgi:glucose-6-phosphate-specific signal transduction histidine kinase
MQEESIRFVWWRHLLVAVGYAAAYVLLRSVSVSNWNLPASLRLAALLLVPMRYWPALVLGEAMPVAWQAWLSHGMFGWAWASFAAFPPMALCAPFMAWFRRRTVVVQVDGRVDIPAVLTAALACAVLTAQATSPRWPRCICPRGSPRRRSPRASCSVISSAITWAR